MGWSPADITPDSSERGTEGGEIVRDEEHDLGARITLERLSSDGPYAITCGVYGWMVHTRFFEARDDADRAMVDMMRDLDAIVLTIPRNDDPHVDVKVDAVSDAISTFVDQYPT